MEYSKQVIEHFEHPRNMGELDANDLDVGVGMIGSPACGDVMQIMIRVKDNIIKDVKFKTFGCGSAVASSSFATECIMGKTLEEALQLKNRDIAEKLDLPPIKTHCSVLAGEAIEAAIKDYKSK